MGTAGGGEQGHHLWASDGEPMGGGWMQQETPAYLWGGETPPPWGAKHMDEGHAGPRLHRTQATSVKFSNLHHHCFQTTGNMNHPTD